MNTDDKRLRPRAVMDKRAAKPTGRPPMGKPRSDRGGLSDDQLDAMRGREDPRVAAALPAARPRRARIMK
jgi:hypothetical protein